MKSIYREGYLGIAQQKISLFTKFYNMFQFHSYQKIAVPCGYGLGDLSATRSTNLSYEGTPQLLRAKLNIIIYYTS